MSSSLLFPDLVPNRKKGLEYDGGSNKMPRPFPRSCSFFRAMQHFAHLLLFIIPAVNDAGNNAADAPFASVARAGDGVSFGL